MAVARYRATAEASGACIVPAMGLEIAPADWGAHVVAERVGGAPDAIDVCYVNATASGAAPPMTRGTKRSIVGVVGSSEARQFSRRRARPGARGLVRAESSRPAAAAR